MNLEDTILKGTKPAGELKNTSYTATMGGLKKQITKQYEEKLQKKDPS